MKFTKKRAMVVSLVVSMIAILSFSTLAWFNAKDDITNKFMIADSDNNGTPDFSVDVWEGDASAKDQDGMEFTNILPGDVLEKNPTVTNTGDYSQWVRVHVTFDEWSVIGAACNKYDIKLNEWINVDDSKWDVYDDATVSGDTITYTYYLNHELVADDSVTLFTKVTIPAAFEQEDMKFISGDFSITVKAEAIQSAHTGEKAKEAFENCWEY